MAQTKQLTEYKKVLLVQSDTAPLQKLLDVGWVTTFAATHAKGVLMILSKRK